MGAHPDRGRFYTRISLVMATCTVVLTFSFIGIVAVVSGEMTNPTSRLPWYIVLSAMAFVATIVLLEGYGVAGREIIVTATIVGLWALLIVALSTEGVIYTINHPEDVFVSRMVLYFLAAGLLGSGIAYWALHHWREFTGRSVNRI